MAVHLSQAYWQFIAPVTAGIVSARVKQLQLKTPHALLCEVNLRHHQLALILRCGLHQAEPVEASLDWPDGLQLAVSCGFHLMVCGAKGAQVQAAGTGATVAAENTAS
jgi:hypothetical protein